MTRISALPALVACCLLGSALSYEHGQIGAMTTSCQHRLSDIFDDYYDVPVLDGNYNCSEILQSAIANQDGYDCPDLNSLLGCFTVS